MQATWLSLIAAAVALVFPAGTLHAQSQPSAALTGTVSSPK